MASKSCTGFKYKFFNSTWSDWSTTLTGGYAGNKTYLTCFQFKTPVIDTLFTDTSLTIKIPYVRQSTASETGTLYVKLHTSDPTGDKGTNSLGDIPNSSNKDASATWSTDDQNVHVATFTINKTLKESTVYYLTVGASSNYLQIGYNGHDDDWAANFNYLSYTSVGVGTTTITDNYDNTFTITATKGANGTNNTASGPTNLKYGYTDSYGSTYTSGKAIDLAISGTAATRTVYATSTTTGVYGAGKAATTSKAIRQYIAPLTSDTIPTIGYTKTKLTLKENWTLSWGAATQRGYSGVAGYRVRVYVDGQSIPIKDSSGNIITKDDGTGAYKYYYDTESTATSMTFYASQNTASIQPGQEVYIMIYAYSKDGKGSKYFSDRKISATFTVQNAATIRVKTPSGTFAEGVAWIKTESGWKEATSVYIKDGTGWHESK